MEANKEIKKKAKKVKEALFCIDREAEVPRKAKKAKKSDDRNLEKKNLPEKKKVVVKTVDYDEQIAALEAELADLDDDDESDSEANAPGADYDSDGSDGIEDPRGDGLVLSSLCAERIPALQAHQLPAVRCAKPGAAAARAGGANAGPRRIEPAPELRARALALVEAYAKSEKLKVPFACRLCAFVGETVEALERHRRAPLHVLATEVFKSSSFCKVCRAQCTSPVELTTHLTSKRHLERMASLKRSRA